jgi:acyl transferase domain-containing protein/acyl carrier protein
MTKIADPLAGLSPERRELLERLRLLQARGAVEQIAVIGIGCRFPGKVTGPESYWRLLTEGRDAVGEVPEHRWNCDAWYDADPQAPGKLSCRFGAFLDDIAGFDADFFGIAPREAPYIDPQHRLLLEVAWESLENAGIAPDGLKESPTAVFVGLSTLDYYRRAFADPSRLGPYCATGTFASAGAGRISYTLGLQGPSLAIDTACSSSLVAVHAACQSLRLGECDMALAGGVSLMVGPELGVSLAKAGMLSPDGRCKTFDASADGYGRGEGCGLVVLKRLSDAKRDRDLIWGVIAGSAVNQDGRSNGLTAPNGRAQQALLRAALKSAGGSSADVGFIEAHGTGTALGDPIEVEALAAVLGAGRPADRPLALGSVKTNIGHLEHAAGVAGLIKALLCLRHRLLVPNLHFREWNPQIAAVAGGVTLHVPTQVEPWSAPDGGTLAGVSSFGFGGTNAHVLLAAAPEDCSVIGGSPSGGLWAAGAAETKRHSPAAAGTPTHPARHVLCLSAKTPAALRELATAYTAVLARTTESIAEICYTAGAGRAHFDCRLAVVADSPRALHEELARWLASPEANPSSNGRATDCADAAGSTDPAEVLVRRYLRRETIDWREVYGQSPLARAPLPTYPFQRTEYWLEEPAPGFKQGSPAEHRSKGAAANGGATNGQSANGTDLGTAHGTNGCAVSNGQNTEGTAPSMITAVASRLNGINGAMPVSNGAPARAPCGANGASADDPEHLREIIERSLIRVLELPEDRRISPDQDLGELGMDSITALELLFAAEKSLSRPLRMPGIAKSRTINQFVAIINGHAGSAGELESIGRSDAAILEERIEPSP